MRDVADDLGISDRGLGKICMRHRVPSPMRGYWARLAAGQDIRRPTLPRVADKWLDCIEIEATLASLPDETRDLLRRARIERAGRRATAVTEEEPATEPGLPVRLHTAVAPTARALRKAKPDEWGAVAATSAGMCGAIVHAGNVERAVAFLNALARALEEEGLRLQPDGARMKVAIGPDDVAFTLTERHRREKHKPTEEEQARHERALQKRDRAARRNDWDSYMSLPYREPWPEYDTIYTGQFVFAVDGWHDGLRKTWADGKTQTVESLLGDIVVGLKVILAHEKIEREQREEAERRRAEMARRRDLARKRKEREEARIAWLNELVELRREAADIRDWLAGLPPEAKDDSATERGRMLAWAQARLADLEALVNLDAAFARIEGKSLFPETDDLHDPLGEPPEPRHYWDIGS
jgi:hypothetical protein